MVMNIVLCGMMGVGKSTVGIKVAELTRRRWFDTDTVIADRHGRISDIFEYYGEAHFRELEAEVIRKLSKEDELVISTGGGSMMNHENCELLKQNRKIFFLKASVETLLKRVLIDETRPLLRVNSTDERLKELLAERTPVYEHVADYVVATDDRTPDEVAEEIVSLLQKAKK